jgi:para-nitrobenzyl esterase
LLIAPRAAKLFQRAIIESGGTKLASVATAENWSDDPAPGHTNSSNEIVARLLVGAGRAKDRADARLQIAAMPPAELATWLRTATPAALLGAYNQRERERGILDLPQPIADGALLADGDAVERYAQPYGWNRVPVMLGTTKDENKIFQFTHPLYVRRWFGVYPTIREPHLYLATADAIASMWKATGADIPAAAMRGTQLDVYVYRFDWDEEAKPFGVDLPTHLGAAHGFEVPFVFGHFDLGPQGNVIFDDANRPGREALSAKLMSYWAEFASSGNPGRGRNNELPPWTAWDPAPAGHKTMHLDTGDDGTRMASDPVTIESVVASVESDARLKTPRDRCWVFHELALWGRGIGRGDYDRREECRAYPFDAFPWS